ncbi:hypothetical protein HNQ88_000267 [Aureibacter tunicatorum]|uniref:Calx-beta domain-containing protein n=2 Tax=Aureibacter tunicatorum TaxID=866807 RepID=A0AAE3XGP4_9BACT|nr:hypothetical protein [Aureibacter tunicatorum]
MMMRKLSIFGMLLYLSAFFYACSDDSSDSVAGPNLTPNESTIVAKTGDVVPVKVNIKAPAGFSEVVVQARVDGNAKPEERVTVSESPVTQKDFVYEYEVQPEDAEGVLVLNFSIIDESSQQAETEVIFEIELGMEDLLTRSNFRWFYQQELIVSGENIMDPGKGTTSMSFNDDGTVNFYLGADDGMGVFASYTDWVLDEEEMKLTLTRLGWLGDVSEEEYDLISINRNELVVSMEVDLSWIEDEDYSENELVTTTLVSQAYNPDDLEGDE